MSFSPFIISNANVILPDGIRSDCCVHCSGGKICEISSYLLDSVSGEEMIDAHNGWLAPGFIDMHIHGAFGYLAGRGRDDTEAMCRELPQCGVTGFLPSICTLGKEDEDVRLLQNLASTESLGAEILGFFLEGHFLALTGAISSLPEYRSREQVENLIAACTPYRAVFGISPEVPGICDLLPAMMAQGFPAFITHTAANAEETMRAIAAGAQHATHFFPYPGEKDPGVRACGAVEAILADPSVSVDFILDGEHMDPIALKMALACKGPGGVSLVTDANVNAGMPPGRYEGVGGYHVEVAYEGGPARCAEDAPMPGGLSGSGLTLDRAVRNVVKLAGLDVAQAVRMASANPATVLGLSGSKGSVRVGYDADLVLLDADLAVEKCWVGGVCRYDAKAESEHDGGAHG